MRRLVFLTVGFGAACALWVYVDGLWLRMALVLGLCLMGALAGRDAKPLARAVLVALGCLAGFGWCEGYDRLYLDAAKTLDGQEQESELRAMDFGERTDYGTVFAGTIVQDGKPYSLRVYLSEELEITPGDYLYGSFRFRTTVPGGAEEGTYHAGKGTFLIAYQRDAVRKVDYPPTRRDIPARLRHKIQGILQETFPADTMGFAKALLIGDTSGLDYETDTHLKLSGIRHVAAVSGLHVSILFALLGMVTGHKRWLMALLGMPGLVLFAAVSGFAPSVNRACLMSGLMLLALLANREYDGPTALAFAVLVSLGLNPLAVTSVSLQLSVASVAGIYLFSGSIRKWLLSCAGKFQQSRLSGWMASSISVSLSAMVLTTPISAWYFGTISLIGPVTNLLTLWVISLIFYGIMGVCGVWFLSAKAAGVFAKVISWPIRYVLAVAEGLSKVPMGSVYTASIYIVIWLVLVYGLLFWFCCSSKRDGKRLSCWAVLGLCIALLAGWTENLLTSVSLTMLDVGQGQCLIFQSEGKSFLIDCGGDSDVYSADDAAAWLLSRGIGKLDGMILTHLDRDHAGGAENLLTRMETDLLILPEKVTELADLTDGTVVYVSQELLLEYGTTKIHIYPPTFPGNGNEMSLCILLETEKCDILVTGDRSQLGEWALMRHADLPKVDILVAGHHGSKGSTSPELLAQIQPDMVWISVGADNSYGHPAPEVLERLKSFGCRVYRTDINGTITIRR